MTFNNEMIKRAYYFFKEKIIVHISGTDGFFYNGEITEIKEPEFLIINDLKHGKTPVFFSVIKRIERYTPKEEIK